MIGAIVRHEWLLFLRDRLLLVTVPVYALLIAYAVYNGAAWQGFLQRNTSAAVAHVERNLDGLLSMLDDIEQGKPFGAYEDPRNPGYFARSLGFEMATKPPASTAALSVGQSDLYPSYLKVQWRQVFSQSNLDETENPVNLAAGRFDLGYVLVYLLPLLIIALSYDILSAEREGGTQALLLSQPITLRQFVLGKILLRGIVIVSIATGLSLFGVLASNPAIVAAGEWWRLGMWSAIVTGYATFWFGLAVLVNALAKKSSTNAIILMASWLVLVLIVPAALNMVAKSLYPLPSRIELVQTMRRADAQAKQEMPASTDSSSAELAARLGEDVVVTSLNQYNKRILPLEQRAEAIAAPLFERFESRRSSQQEFAQRLRFLSPAIVVQAAIGEIADTSTASYDRFSAAVREYQQQWRAYFLPRVLNDQLLTRADMVGVPRFKYVPASGGEVFRRTLVDLLSLALLAVVVIAAGSLRLQRYPVAGS